MNNLKPAPEYRRGYKNRDRLSRIAKLPCSLCLYLNEEQKTKTTVHHLHGEGMGKKQSDLLTMSLCAAHHQTGPYAFHHIGRIAFEERFNVDQEMLIKITNKLLETCFFDYFDDL